MKTAPLDLVLVNPGSRASLYQTLGATLTAVENPVWAGLIATFVLQKGFDRIAHSREFDGKVSK